MTTYQLKKDFQNLLRPSLGLFVKAGLTPNYITLFAALVSMTFGASLYIWPSSKAFLFMPIWMFLRMALNAIDGMIAKEFSMTSSLGVFLNELGDFVSDLFLIVAFLHVPGFSQPLVLGLMGLTGLIELASVVAVQIGSERRFEGPLGKSDRALVLGLLGVIVGFHLGPHWLANAILTISVLAAGWTLYRRVSCALVEAEAKASPGREQK